MKLGQKCECPHVHGVAGGGACGKDATTEKVDSFWRSKFDAVGALLRVQNSNGKLWLCNQCAGHWCVHGREKTKAAIGLLRKEKDKEWIRENQQRGYSLCRAGPFADGNNNTGVRAHFCPATTLFVVPPGEDFNASWAREVYLRP